MKVQYKSGGDTRDGNRMMLKNQAVEFKHHATELSNAVKKAKHVDAWVVAKAERATTDLSDITHYLDGQSDNYAKGGVTYVDARVKDTDYYRKYYTRYPNAIGSFQWGTKEGSKSKYYNLAEGILYPLDEFDREYYAHLLRGLRKGEYLFRYRTDRMLKDERRLIKMNLDKSLVYFMDSENMDEHDDKNIKFLTRGVEATYIVVEYDKLSPAFRYEHGGETTDGLSLSELSDAQAIQMANDIISKEIGSDDSMQLTSGYAARRFLREYHSGAADVDENEIVDHFSKTDGLPNEVVSVIERYSDIEHNRDTLSDMRNELMSTGYNFDYDDDMIPHSLRRIGEEDDDDGMFADGGMMADGGSVQYPSDLKIGSIIKGVGFPMLQGIDDGKYYKVIEMDNFSATFVLTDEKGKRNGVKKIRHRLSSIQGGIKSVSRGDNNGIQVISYSDGGMMAKGGKIEMDVVVKTPKGIVTKKDFEGFTKKEIIEWCEERGWVFNPKGEKLGGRILKEYEFFIKSPTKYNVTLPKKSDGGMMAKGGELINKIQKEIDNHKEESLELYPNGKMELLNGFYGVEIDGRFRNQKYLGAEYIDIDGIIYKENKRGEMKPTKLKLASGGMMAKGGEVRKVKGRNFSEQIENNQRFKSLIQRVFDEQVGEKYPMEFIRATALNSSSIVKWNGKHHLRGADGVGVLSHYEFMDDPNFIKALDYVDRPKIRSMKNKGGIESEQASIGDSALVLSENKLGTIVSIDSGKYLLQFVDGTTKSYNASELKFITDEDDYPDEETAVEPETPSVPEYTQEKIREAIEALQLLAEMGDQEAQEAIDALELLLTDFDADDDKIIAYTDDPGTPIGTFKSREEAKKFAKANKWKYDEITFEDKNGDTIRVSKDDKFKDIDWLFGSLFSKGGMMADGGRISKGVKWQNDWKTTDGQKGFDILEVVDTKYFSTNYRGGFVVRSKIIDSSDKERIGEYSEDHKDYLKKVFSGKYESFARKLASGGMMSDGDLRAEKKKMVSNILEQFISNTKYKSERYPTERFAFAIDTPSANSIYFRTKYFGNWKDNINVSVQGKDNFFRIYKGDEIIRSTDYNSLGDILRNLHSEKVLKYKNYLTDEYSTRTNILNSLVSEGYMASGGMLNKAGRKNSQFRWFGEIIKPLTKKEQALVDVNLKTSLSNLQSIMKNNMIVDENSSMKYALEDLIAAKKDTSLYPGIKYNLDEFHEKVATYLREEGKLIRESDDDYGKGGTTFQDKVNAISGRLEGTQVPRRLRSDYGRRYNKEEAKKAAQRIAGAMIKKGY